MSARSAYCFVCRYFNKNKNLNCISNFNAWSRGASSLKNHDNSEYHKIAYEAFVNRSGDKPCVASQLINQYSADQLKKRNYVKFLFESVVFLSKQGLAFRGHRENNLSSNKGNFLELVEMRIQDKPEFKSFFDDDSCNYLSHQSQDEMIKIIAKRILKNIIPTSFFSLIIDETSDITNDEQVSVCVRYVDEFYIIHEHFLGFWDTKSTTGEALYELILKIFKQLNLNIKNLIGQAYDGAANMSGTYKGVAARIKLIQPKAVFIHCLAHRLNLAIQDSCNANKSISDTLTIVQNLYCFIEASPKRHSMFRFIQNEEESAIKSLKKLCATRWSCRYSSIKAVVSLYDSVLMFLRVRLILIKYSDFCSKIRNISDYK